MKVAIISGEMPAASAGGIGTVVHHLRERLEDDGVSTEIVCTDEFEGSSVTALPAPGPHPIKDLTFGRNFRTYAESVRDGVDVFHFHLPNARGPLLFAPEWVRQRSVVSVHTTPWGYHRYLYEQVPYRRLDRLGQVHKLGYSTVPIRLERRALRNVPVRTAVSSGVAAEVAEAYDVPVPTVVPNGIEPERLHEPSPGDGSTVLFVGRLVAQKGLERGLDALDHCDSEFDLKVVGTGALDERLRREADRRSVDAEFLGFVDRERLLREYAAADVLFMPSYYEGLPMVGIEGAGSGLPIAAARTARVGDVVCEENQQYVVDASDPRTLATAVDDVLSRPERVARIRRANRNRVREQFTAEGMTAAYRRLYAEVSG